MKSAVTARNRGIHMSKSQNCTLHIANCQLPNVEPAGASSYRVRNLQLSICNCQFAMLFVFLIAFGGISGCGRKAPELPPPKPPEVEVCVPYPDKVTDYEDFTG